MYNPQHPLMSKIHPDRKLRKSGRLDSPGNIGNIYLSNPRPIPKLPHHYSDPDCYVSR